MNCYVCDHKGVATTAVGLCRHCQVVLCRDHLAEAQAHTTGGMTAYSCPHAPLPVRTTSR